MNFEEEAVARIKSYDDDDNDSCLFTSQLKQQLLKNHHPLLSSLLKKLKNSFNNSKNSMGKNVNTLNSKNKQLLVYTWLLFWSLMCLSPCLNYTPNYNTADFVKMQISCPLTPSPPPPMPCLIIKLQTCLHTTRIYLACFWCKFPSYYLLGSWHPINMFVIEADE